MFTLKTKPFGFLILLLASILSLSLRAGAAAPTYSVSVGSGSFSPNPICSGMTATAKLSASLNVQNPNSEIQESGDSWGWSASVTGYAASSQAAFGAVPSGTIAPVVGASSGSATSTVTATASQTTSPGYYQVTVTAKDSFTLTDSSTKPATVTSQSQSGSTTLEITVVVLGSLQYYNPNVGGYVAVPSVLNVSKGQSIKFKVTLVPSDASFPAGQPVWGGTSGASGSGSTITVTFSTTSSTTADYKTVTATCGNTLTANVLVVQISAVSASIASTPAVTLRSPTTSNKPARVFTTSQTSATWAAGATTSIVLVEGSTTVPLQATVLPSGFAPSWTVIRNPQDAPGLKQSPYPANDLSLSSQSGGSTNVSLNAVGSFSVVAYVDTFGNSTFNPTAESGIFFNVVSANVAYHQDSSISPTPQNNTKVILGNSKYYVNSVPVLNYTGNPMTAGQVFGAQAGTTFDVTNPGAAGEYLKCQVDLVGGGSDGTLGLDRVLTGWCQNISVNAVAGNYQNNHTIRGLLTNADIAKDANGNTPSNNYITQAANLPMLLTPALSSSSPILDTGDPTPSTGGVTVCLTSSTDSNVPQQPLPLGERRTAEAVDSPGNFVPLYHPLTGTDQAKQFIWNLTFRAYLVVWTGTVTADSGEPGANTYSVVEEVPWYIGTTLTLAPPDTSNPAKSIATVTSPIVTHASVVPMNTIGGETYLPRVLDRAEVFDATH